MVKRWDAQVGTGQRSETPDTRCTTSTGTFPTRFTFVEFRTVHHNLRKSKYVVLLLGI
jgi:hypothetical protein